MKKSDGPWRSPGHRLSFAAILPPTDIAAKKGRALPAKAAIQKKKIICLGVQ